LAYNCKSIRDNMFVAKSALIGKSYFLLTYLFCLWIFPMHRIVSNAIAAIVVLALRYHRHVRNVLILACACLLRFGRISARKTISIDDALCTLTRRWRRPTVYYVWTLTDKKADLVLVACNDSDNSTHFDLCVYCIDLIKH